MTDWFYRVSDSGKAEENGPVTAQVLLQLIRDGGINEETLIRKDNSNWVRSVEVNGLWDAAGRPSAAFVCPHCGRPIAKPPVTCGACHQRVQHAVGHLVQTKKIVARPTKLASPAVSKKPQTEGPTQDTPDRPESEPNTGQPKRSWFSLKKK